MNLTLVRRPTYTKALLGILLLLATLFALLYLPELQNPAPPAAVVHRENRGATHRVPLVVRHAPAPVVRYVHSLPK